MARSNQRRDAESDQQIERPGLLALVVLQPGQMLRTNSNSTRELLCAQFCPSPKETNLATSETGWLPDDQMGEEVV